MYNSARLDQLVTKAISTSRNIKKLIQIGMSFLIHDNGNWFWFFQDMMHLHVRYTNYLDHRISLSQAKCVLCARRFKPDYINCISYVFNSNALITPGFKFTEQWCYVQSRYFLFLCKYLVHKIGLF